ncbi:hypothetical protein IG631_19006 [Alternaria alternata]|nr:hypothetical protein IG631_19006 [Alternaria alternata]
MLFPVCVLPGGTCAGRESVCRVGKRVPCGKACAVWESVCRVGKRVPRGKASAARDSATWQEERVLRYARSQALSSLVLKRQRCILLQPVGGCHTQNYCPSHRSSLFLNVQFG